MDTASILGLIKARIEALTPTTQYSKDDVFRCDIATSTNQGRRQILIEGTETGNTLRANNLTMIDLIMESTNCVIVAAERPAGRRGELRDQFIERLVAAATAAE